MVVRESGLPPADAAISLGKAKRDPSSTSHGLLDVSVQCGTAQDRSVKRAFYRSVFKTDSLCSCRISLGCRDLNHPRLKSGGSALVG